MPTILYINGWRFFFYSNELREPMHIHAQKAEMEAKFWIDAEQFEIHEAFAYQISPKDRRELKKIIYFHVEYIIDQWTLFHGKE